MISLEKALSLVLEGVEPLQAESVAIHAASGRVLAADLVALRTQPPTDVSSMDGYAVAGVASSYKVVGESAAGHPFQGALEAGEAVRIFTGASLPQGANAIVMQENISREGDTITPTVAMIEGRYIRKKGMDFIAGEVALQKGTLLSPNILGLATALNHISIAVVRKPRVAVLSTGDELVEAGNATSDNHIVSTNAKVIAALAQNSGALVQDYGIAPDNLEQLTAIIKQILATKPDVFITSGGASVGDHDLVQKVLKGEGMNLGFWKIAMRPGKPLIHGKVSSTHILGLPGNPVSSFVCATIFMQPLLEALQGLSPHTPLLSGIMTHDLPENDERAEYMRGTATLKNGVWQCETFKNQDSSLLSTLAKSNALIFRDVKASALKAGEAIEFLLLN